MKLRNWGVLISALLTVSLASLASGCGSSKKLTSAELIAEASPSVVRIQGKHGAGSGFVVDARRQLVLTNAHVVDGNVGFRVQVGNDASTSTPAQVVASAPCDDLAVMRLVNPVPNLKALPLGRSSTVKPGDQVTVLGFPGNLEPGSLSDAIPGQATTVTANTGNVSSVNVKATPSAALPDYQSTIEHQAPTNHGNSGGPLMDANGKVVGVNTLGNVEAQGQYYSISIDYVNRILPDLEAGHSRGVLGWKLVPLSYQNPALEEELEGIFAAVGGSDPRGAAEAATALAKHYQSQGMYNLGDTPNSPAEKANVVTGDLVEEINSTPVTTLQDICDQVNAASPGDTLRVTGAAVAESGLPEDFDEYFVPHRWSDDLQIPRS
jgi:S1-C subfamily serine protease